MRPVEFSAIPDSGRLWIFHATTAFTPAQAERLRAGLTQIITAWVSHSSEVRAGFELRENRFVLVGADESAAPLAGCSMDSLRDSVAQLGRSIGLELLDSPPVVWRETGQDGTAICAGSRPEFKERIQAGAVTSETHVFDLTLETVGAVRAGLFERAFRESWHAKAFRLPAPGAATTTAATAAAPNARAT